MYPPPEATQNEDAESMQSLGNDNAARPEDGPQDLIQSPDVVYSEVED